MWFDTIKKYYDEGHLRYTDESIKVFVKAEMITDTEYFEITGIEYVA